jgi:phosphoesterase RecJ-like protein
MYFKKIEDLRVTAYVLNNFHVSEHGIAYYVLSDAIQKELNITSERGKENVNLFSNIDGINAWCSITEDAKDSCYRVSIRSKQKPINQVAAKYEGGGHAQASGAKLNSLDDLPAFIQDLDALFA